MEFHTALTPSPEAQNGFQDSWTLRCFDPDLGSSLILRFAVTSSQNGFRRVAEVWALHFEKSHTENEEFEKTVFKQTFDISAFNAQEGEPAGIRIGECELTENYTRGRLQSKGQELKWEFALTPAQPAKVNLVPEVLKKSRLSPIRFSTACADLRFSGFLELNKKRTEWRHCPGIQNHTSGFQSRESRIWAQANHFINERGEPDYCLFEGLSTRAYLAGLMRSPQLSTFYFYYQQKEYRLNSLWQALRSRSRSTHDSWNFQADIENLTFKGEIRSDLRNFAGVSIEAMDGSWLYNSISSCATLTLWVYRRGKLETTLVSPQAAQLEFLSPRKNPYVPVLS